MERMQVMPVTYAVDELQNPLPCKTMLFEGVMNSTDAGEMMSLQKAKGFGYRFNII